MLAIFDRQLNPSAARDVARRAFVDSDAHAGEWARCWPGSSSEE